MLRIHLAVPFLLMGLTGAMPSLAATVSVGTGCTYSSLQAAFTALASQTGNHTIRLRTQTFATPDGSTYQPTVTQGTVLIEGGYAQCSDSAPTSNQTSTLDGSGGLARSTLRLAIEGRIATLQIRRLVIRGGDATDDATFNGNGGGLLVNGPATVLLGTGTTIRNNQAVRGGGIALAGGLLSSLTAAKVNLHIDEGASISNNTAAEEGGGIFCGAKLSASTDIYRHGSIVGIDGVIGNNSASGQGAAFYCLGTVEGGGGLLPSPRNGAALLILGNQVSPPGVCAAGYATLDASVAKNAEGYRPLGAAAGETGLLAIVGNQGSSPALCLWPSRRIGTTITPPDESVFQLQNLVISDQSGSGDLGLSLLGSEMRLRVRPSGRSTTCSLFSPTPCVSFAANSTTELPGSGYPSYLIKNLGNLELVRASVRDNLASRSLVYSYNRGFSLESSVVTGNTVQLPGSSWDTVRSAFLIGWGPPANFSGQASIIHSTIRFTTPLDRFFTLDHVDSAVTARASIFSSSASPAPDTIGGAAAPSRFRREWCGFFQSTWDFASHTVVPDPTSGQFVTFTPASFSWNPATYVPGLSLADYCTRSTEVDFHGKRFGSVRYFPGAGPADIGAVENRDDVIFDDGFERL